jgi:tetratricopeptide (TPR) repeat protein
MKSERITQLLNNIITRAASGDAEETQKAWQILATESGDNLAPACVHALERLRFFPKMGAFILDPLGAALEEFAARERWDWFLRGLDAAIHFHINANDSTEARQLIIPLAEAAERLDSPYYRLIGQFREAELALLDGQYQNASDQFLRLIEAVDDHHSFDEQEMLRSSVLQQWISVLLIMGELEQASEKLATMNPASSSWVAYHTGYAAQLKGDHKRAREMYFQTLALSENELNPRWVFESFLELAMVDPDHAPRHLKEAEKLGELLGLSRRVTQARARHALTSGDFKQARSLASTLMPQESLQDALVVADVFYMAGPPQRAIEAVDLLGEKALEHGFIGLCARAHMMRSGMTQEPELRAKHVVAALELSRKLGDIRIEAGAQLQKASLEFDLGDAQKAEASALVALDLGRRHGLPEIEASAWMLMGQAAQTNGLEESAIGSLEKALSLARTHQLWGLEITILKAQGKDAEARVLAASRGRMDTSQQTENK